MSGDFPEEKAKPSDADRRVHHAGKANEGIDENPEDIASIPSNGSEEEISVADDNECDEFDGVKHWRLKGTDDDRNIWTESMDTVAIDATGDEKEHSAEQVEVGEPTSEGEQYTAKSLPTKGLVLKKSPKEHIGNGNIDLKELAIVIGPKYILKHIAVNPDVLPEAPHHPLLDLAHNPVPEDLADEEFEQEKNRIANRGYIRDEYAQRSRDGHSRFYGSGHVTWKIRRGRRNKLSNRIGKRGLRGNRIIPSILARLLPKYLQPTPINLESVGTECFIQPMASTLNAFDPSVLSHLPVFKTNKHMSFKVINTVKKLDDIDPHTEKTILLQWGRAKPSIRDFRVDGVQDEPTRLERVAWFIDRNLGKVRLFIDEWKIPIIGATLLLGIIIVVFVFSAW